MKTYTEKLRDPRWQKKRLEILERDNWKCTLCLDAETTLHVHHEDYFGDPWEVDSDCLKTICADCHFLISSNIIEEDISTILKSVMAGVIWFVIKTKEGSVAFCTYNTNKDQWQGVFFGDVAWKTVFEYLNEVENPNEE